MEYNKERASRRARHRPLQSCEIVGILPAEEAALNRALYASLLQDSPPKKAQDNSISLADNIKPEPLDEASDSMLPCSRLSSPELYEEQDYLRTSLHNLGPSASGSCPSSPQSNNSLHLCISSSSWPSSVSSNSSCDSLFMPNWNSGSDSKLSNKKRGGPKDGGKKGLHRSLKSKRTLEFDHGVVKESKAKKPKVKEMQTAKKSAINAPMKSNSSCGQLSPGPFQARAQRKFAASHPLPVRISLGEVKAVAGLKQPPKTEDFITYLNLRGSSRIPKRFKKFESPWTPVRRKMKTTKPKK